MDKQQVNKAKDPQESKQMRRMEISKTAMVKD